MNYRLLFFFLVAQAIEFSLYYAIATGVSLAANSWGYDVNAMRVFTTLVGIDIILTVLTYSDQIAEFMKQLLSKGE